ncbi:hypothetical protein [Xanthomonas fragariae]|uniref:hypothetical protein n=1 Tax=Xanthomonas fragariae TaxID=48664 RepID=UPI00190109C6|nr:hypothetical protein [Xanthomonas fragariae]
MIIAHQQFIETSGVAIGLRRCINHIRVQSIAPPGVQLQRPIARKTTQALRRIGAEPAFQLIKTGTSSACRRLDYADSSCGFVCLERPPLLPIRDI